MKRTILILALALAACSSEDEPDSLNLSGVYTLEDPSSSCEANEALSFSGSQLEIFLAYMDAGECIVSPISATYKVEGSRLIINKKYEGLFDYSGTILSDTRIQVTTKFDGEIEKVQTYSK